MKPPKRTASKFSTHTDQQGRRIVRLDVGGGENAVLTLADWERVRRFWPTWYLAGDGRGNRYVVANRPKPRGLITMGRVIVEARPGQRVTFRDGDRLNHLPENLAKGTGASKRAAIKQAKGDCLAAWHINPL